MVSDAAGIALDSTIATMMSILHTRKDPTWVQTLALALSSGQTLYFQEQDVVSFGFHTAAVLLKKKPSVRKSKAVLATTLSGKIIPCW